MTTKKTLLYYDVAERIKAYITVTPLAVGALLPPERLLAQKLDVSVVTVRKALDCLVNESVIEKLARRGNRVLNVPVPEGGKRKKRVGITIWLDAGACIFYRDFHPLMNGPGQDTHTASPRSKLQCIAD